MTNKIKVVFLGNSASLPTALRNLSSVLINYNGENYLFDCPENCQQQIMKSKQSIMKINNIFISHLHGDHYFGLFGLLSSFKLNNRTNDLNIFVPTGDKEKIRKIINLVLFDKHKAEYKINIMEAEKGEIFGNSDICIFSLPLDHSIKTNGYVFKIKDKLGKFNKEKAIKLKIPEGPLFSKLQKGQAIKINGKTIKPNQVMDYNYKKTGIKIAYLCDTAVLKKVPKILEKTDILIHESTFFEEEKEKAKIVKHTIAEELLVFAKKANVKNIYLIHISTKYPDLDKKEKELQKKYKQTNIVNCLQELNLDIYSK